jgi:hypothetical protein
MLMNACLVAEGYDSFLAFAQSEFTSEGVVISSFHSILVLLA